ncbi:hypothetical protein ACQEVF_25045 [Nonomuraea polychroma]|uniref:hypothetical protein n=1 Tax=Nonomuraea polychroma TaxID=46176 RepID=UPI003D91B4CC
MSYIDRTTRILATLAHLAAARTGSEGAVLHHALYATLLAIELRLAPGDADDRAADPAWNDNERALHDRARELVDQARRAIRAAEYAQPDEAWTPNERDTVTWDGHDGTWVVRSYEDDDTVWIHRPDVRMVPAIGRNGGGMVDLVGWRDVPEREELVAIAALRPAEQPAAVTR